MKSTTTSADNADADQSSRLQARAERACGRFKLAAVSSFTFVEAAGPLYAAKLVRDALKLPQGPNKMTSQPRFSDDFTIADRIAAAGSILGAMSLTDNFAPLVLLVGHGPML